jgi:hypothetical protein
MKTIWIVLAVSACMACAGVCGADELKDIKELPASSSVVDDKEATKLADSLLPAASKEEGTPVADKGEEKPAAAAPTPETCAPAPCVSCFQTCVKSGRKCKPARCNDGICHRLKEWFCYRPLERPGICGCCQKGNGCHVPPLYYYFLDRCDGGGCSGCAMPAAPTGCCAGGACQAHP